VVSLAWIREHGLRILTHAGSLAPLAWLLWRTWRGLYVVDPVKQIEDSTGQTALVLLVLCLACTPISTAFGLKQVIRVRRALGMYAFGYASLHFTVFAAFDYQFKLAQLAPALFEQRFVVVGFVCGLLLVPLALTSTKSSQKRLGRNWTRLHRLIYLAGALAVLHFLWSVKDSRVPLRYGAVVAVLLVLRIPVVRMSVSGARQRVTACIKRTRTPSRKIEPER
jgi:sulfoxide reductase heme-binding subunit YedZ